MADTVKLVITTDSASTNRAFGEINKSLNGLDVLAARVTQSIGNHFMSMARQVQQAFAAVGQQINQMQSQAMGLARSSSGLHPQGTVLGPGGAVVSSVSSRSSFPQIVPVVSSPSPYHPPYPYPTNQPNIINYTGKSANYFDQMMEAADKRDYLAEHGASKRMLDEQEAKIQKAHRLMEESRAITEKQAAAAKGAAGANNELANSHKKVGDSMGGSILKGIAWYELINKGISVMKAFTIDAAKGAAETQMYATSMYSLATANGVTADTVDDIEVKIKKLGFTTRDTHKAMTEGLIAGVPMDKMEALAKLSKEVAAGHPGTSKAEVFDSFIQSAETGMMRGIKRLGVIPDVSKAAEVKYAKENHLNPATMDETDMVQFRVQQILKEMNKFAGTAGASADQIGGKMAQMKKAVADASDVIGEQFVPVMGVIAGLVTGIANFVTEHPWLAKVIGVVGATGVGAGIGAGVGTAVFPGIGSGAGAVYGGITAAWAATSAIIYADDHKPEADAAKAKARIEAAKQALENGKQIKRDRAREKREAEAQLMYEALKDGRRESESAIFEAKTKGLEGFDAIRADYQRRRQALLSKGGPGAHDSVIERNLVTAEGIEKEGVVTKTVRDLTREISQEKANQLEGMKKIDALSNLELDKLSKLYDGNAKILEAQKALTAERKKSVVLEAERNSRDQVRQAELELYDGYKKINEQLELQIQLLKERGIYTAKTLADANKEADIRAQILDRQNSEENDRMRDELKKSSIGLDLDRLNERQQVELAGLERMSTYTLKQKQGVEQQKYEIELKYLQLMTDKKRELRQLELNDELDDLKKKLDRTDISKLDYDARREAIQKRGNDELGRITEQGSVASTELLKKNIHAQRALVEEANRSLYDHIKNQASGIFDAMLAKSQSVWQAMGNMFKIAFLTVLKEIITSNIAKSFTALLSGQNVNLTPASPTSNTGFIGKITNALGNMGFGSRPDFSGGNAGGGRSTSGSTGPTGGGSGNPLTRAMDLARGSGAGAAGLGLGAGATAAAAQLASAGWVPMPVTPGTPATAGLMINTATGQIASATALVGKAGAFSFLGKYQSAAQGVGMMMGSTMAMQGLKQGGLGGTINRSAGAGLAAYSMFGKSLGWMGSAGIGLGYDGLVRGGWMGAGEATVGGALIGMQYGGPLGAAIGAGVGFAAGLIRMVIGGDSPATKMRKRVKALTGLDITQESVLKQMVKAAGGTSAMEMDLYIRSKAGQDLLETYAQQTGKKFRSAFNARSFSMVQSGGALYEMASYQAGSALNPLSSLPGIGFSPASLDTVSNGMSTGSMAVTLQIDGPATAQLMQGEAINVITSNPRLIALAANDSYQSSSGRRTLGVTMNRPGEVLS